jgi:small-conductance mechanosensitive channel
MPRPKGSKNKPALTLDEQITAATTRVEELKAALTAAEEELRTLTALRDEEQVKELLAAIASSGRSIHDVIAMIKGGTPE